jgi:tetratricopeptide (TPR) repeat protein
VRQGVSDWSHARYLAEGAAVQRLMEQGRHEEAVRAAAALYANTQAAGEAAYEQAAYDGAVAQFILGRAFRSSGAAAEALGHLEEARRRFQSLGEVRMAKVALNDKSDCLTKLGRYNEAADSYVEATRTSEQLRDARGAAVSRGQLATVRMLQKQYAEALDIYTEARKTFQELGEPRSVAVILHQIGIVYENAGQYEAAEGAYQESLRIEVQTDNPAGEALTLGQLGNLYSRMERREDAVRLYRQAAEVFVKMRDLRSEGGARNNIGNQLASLKRYDEARVELERAIECKKPFGHAAQLWKTFDILSDLERQAANETAARQARNQAVQAYLAYRHAGGECQSEAFSLASEHLTELSRQPNLPQHVRALVQAVEAVLAGSRDVRLADDPNLHYMDAAEILLLIESLTAQATGA